MTGRADVAVAPGHGAGLDVVVAVADDHVGAGGERRHQVIEVAEIVGVVAVAHDEPFAAGLTEAATQGRAVAAHGLVHDDGAGVGRELGRAVVGAVVDNDDFAGVAGAFKPAEGLADADLHRLLLVETGHDD